MILHWSGILVELREKRWFADFLAGFCRWNKLGGEAERTVGSAEARLLDQLAGGAALGAPYPPSMFPSALALFKSSKSSHYLPHFLADWLSFACTGEEDGPRLQNDTLLSLEPIGSSDETNCGQMRISASKTKTRAESTKFQNVLSNALWETNPELSGLLMMLLHPGHL